MSLLEAAAGIPVRRTLSDYTWHVRIILGLAQNTDLDLNGLLNYWTSSVQWLPPLWKNLLLIIRLLNLDELAQRMEAYLSAGATEEEKGERFNTIQSIICNICTIIVDN